MVVPIFDFGGTIVDDLDIVYMISKEIISSHGVTPPSREQFNEDFSSDWMETYRKRGIGRDEAELTRLFQERFFRPEFSGNVRAYDGAQDVLTSLNKTHNLAINTSYRMNELDLLFRIIGVEKGLFDVIVTEDVVANRKPSPDGVLLVSERLNVAPHNCLMIGDTASDIQCGKRAGSRTMAVSWGTNNIDDLILLKPDYVAHSWSELYDHIKGMD